MVVTSSRCNNTREEATENDEDVQQTEGSLEVPIYDTSNVVTSGVYSGKSGYNVPPPASYGTYLLNLGVGLPYSYGPYNRYGLSPYTAQSPYSYATLLNKPFASPLTAGIGNGSPYFGMSSYPDYGFVYPSYVPGLGYPQAAFRSGFAPDPNVPAPFVGIGSSVPRSAAIIPGPFPVRDVPPAIAASALSFPRSATSVPAPFATFPAPQPSGSIGIATIPQVSSSVPSGVYFRGSQSKDGSIRYVSAPTYANNLY